MSAKELPRSSDVIVQPWKDTLLGERDRVSDDNEDAWREMLLNMCQGLAENARSVIEHSRKASRGQMGWVGAMEGNIKMLWAEEHHVSEAVAQSLSGKEEF